MDIGGAMRNAILMILLSVVSTSAAAQWSKWVIVDRGPSFVIYADIATIRKAGDIAQMWDLSDTNTDKALGGVKQSPSIKIEREYDCNKQQLRVLCVSWHSENMGGGKTTGSASSPGIWQPALQGTIGERFWRIACGVDRSRHL